MYILQIYHLPNSNLNYINLIGRKETACCQSSLFFNVKKKPSLSIRSISTVICITKMHPSMQQLCLVADASMKARKGYLHRVEQVTHSLPLLLRSLKWIIDKVNKMLFTAGYYQTIKLFIRIRPNQNHQTSQNSSEYSNQIAMWPNNCIASTLDIFKKSVHTAQNGPICQKKYEFHLISYSTWYTASLTLILKNITWQGQ